MLRGPMQVQISTGFAPGLFTALELNSDFFQVFLDAFQACM